MNDTSPILHGPTEMELLDWFRKYWEKQNVSPLDRSEWIAIEIFSGWLYRNYTILPKA